LRSGKDGFDWRSFAATRQRVIVSLQGGIENQMVVSGETLEEQIRKVRDVRVAVIGIGYVGLPLAVRLAETGFAVVGVDIKKEIVDQLNAGNSTVEGLTGERVRKVIAEGRLSLLLIDASKPSETDPETLATLIGVQVFIVCVPTPLHHARGWEPETHWISDAAQVIRRVGEMEIESGSPLPERLLVLESTTYPGTTREIFTPILNLFDAQGLRCYLAYSPERTSPGPESNDDGETEPVPGRHPSTFQITRIVGGADEQSRDVAVALYESIFSNVRVVESLETAEMIKLVENTFRFISIGFANEMARIARAFGLNIWSIIEAAKTKGFGLDLCFPGLIGGHCLPIDPHYLSWTVRNRRQMATFVDVAESAHQSMRRDALDLIQRLLNQRKRGVSGASILFFGIAYKKNVGDIRESAVLELMKRLYIYGADVHFWDPVRAGHAAKQRPRLLFSDEERRLLTADQSKPLSQLADGSHYFEPEELSGSWDERRQSVLQGDFDCVVLATDHDIFHVAYMDLLLADEGPPIADLRNAIQTWLRGIDSPDDILKILTEKLDERSRYMLMGVH
jgi:UDP-N-acetyl-D-glucosamine dehydrogenase